MSNQKEVGERHIENPFEDYSKDKQYSVLNSDGTNVCNNYLINNNI